MSGKYRLRMAPVVFQLLDRIRNINPEEVLNPSICAQCHGIRPFLCSLFIFFSAYRLDVLYISMVVLGWWWALKHSNDFPLARGTHSPYLEHLCKLAELT